MQGDRRGRFAVIRQINMIKSIIILLLTLLSCSVCSDEIEWQYSASHETSFHPDDRMAIIKVYIAQRRDNNPDVTISITIGDYVYKHSYNSFIAFKKDVAPRVASSFFDERNFIECSELRNVGAGWADVVLEISEQKLSELQNSKCRGFIHAYQWEIWRTIVFPIDSNEPIVINYHGV